MILRVPVRVPFEESKPAPHQNKRNLFLDTMFRAVCLGTVTSGRNICYGPQLTPMISVE